MNIYAMSAIVGYFYNHYAIFSMPGNAV